jgi:hypothetical protein
MIGGSDWLLVVFNKGESNRKDIMVIPKKRNTPSVLTSHLGNSCFLSLKYRIKA